MWQTAFIAAVLAAVSVSVQPSSGIREQRVQFSRGAASATLTGSLTGEETVDYLLGANAGQTMTVTLKGGTSVSFNVLPPGSEAAIAIGETVGPRWSGSLPASGDYRVRVFLGRAAARRKEKASYTLTIGIAGTADARVPGTTFHATGQVPCSVGTDPAGSAQCSFGVVRLGGGRADVHLANPGYDVKLHADQVRVLRFDGSAVTSADPALKVKAEKRGDQWSVTVNDFRHYVIPDAVIVGG